jgi:serine protease Do
VAAALERAFVQVIAQTEKSVVSIARIRLSESQQARNPGEFNPFGFDLRATDPGQDRNDPESPDFVPNEFGTGIIVAPDGRPDDRAILTNYHVVRGGPADGAGPPTGDSRLYVWIAGGKSCEARIFAADPRSDLAVLKVDFAQLGLKPADLAPLKLRDAATPLKKGQLVLALGNPYAIARDGSASASWGLISNISRRPAPIESSLDESVMSKETLHHLGTLLQVDTRLNLGTSGGALVNLRGELTGVTTSLAALQGYEKSVGYAVPIDAVTRRIIQDLCLGHEVEYGFLGMSPANVLPEEMQRRAPQLRQASAAKVVSVIPGSPAAEAGLARDDWVVDVNGDSVRNRVDLMRLVGQLPPETAARLRVWRSRERRELTLTVNLGKWPVFDDEGIVATVPRYPDWRGLAVDYPTGRKKYFDWPHEFHEAVVITKIVAGGKAQAAGLYEGEFVARVNGQPVRTPGEFHRAVKGQEGDVTLELVGDRRVVIRR